MQPLDVSCFRSIKGAWRKVLKTWKLKTKGPPRKDLFPSLLNSTLSKIAATNPVNIQSGFEAIGLDPKDRQKVLKKLPTLTNDGANLNAFASESLESLFKEKGFGKDNQYKRGQRKKINADLGKALKANIL